MPHSANAASRDATGIELEHETFGSPDHPTLLLVCGFTSQLVYWEPEFCERFTAAVFHVVRFDNRDVGLSSHLDGQRVDPMAALTALQGRGAMPEVPYTLSDMAADAVALLDHLAVRRAHVMGVSMGGMIVQTMAIEHPGRLASMTSVMSSPGDLSVGKPTPEARSVLLAAPPSEREAFIDHAERSAVWASKRYVDVERLRLTAAVAYDRCFHPAGSQRQLAAIYASGDRSEQLRHVGTPSLVIHGRDDTLIDPSGGVRTAELIPGAHLLLLAGMGHDLPPQLWPYITDAVTSHARFADVTAEHS